MPHQATYFLGRVVKLGTITQESLVQAVANPLEVRFGDFAYTFTDIQLSDGAELPRFAYAKLSKFIPYGEIRVVEPERHVAASADIANLLIASSPFIYIPEFSGVAYPHLWNRLTKDTFERAFSELIVARHGGIFAEVIVEPIADMRTFVQQVAGLTTVSKIEATVHPPNPLFGAAWKSLRNYMRTRNSGELHVREEAEVGESIGTGLPSLAAVTMEGAAVDNEARLRERLEATNESVTDAAVLMAADGYGRARIIGRRGERSVSIRTQQSQVTFASARDPEPEELYEEAHRVLSRISRDRYMEHS